MKATKSHDGGNFKRHNSGIFVIAEYDYVGLDEQELSFKTGQRIEVIQANQKGKWLGKCDNRIGLFQINLMRDCYNLQSLKKELANQKTNLI